MTEMQGYTFSLRQAVADKGGDTNEMRESREEIGCACAGGPIFILGPIPEDGRTAGEMEDRSWAEDFALWRNDFLELLREARLFLHCR